MQEVIEALAILAEDYTDPNGYIRLNELEEWSATVKAFAAYDTFCSMVKNKSTTPLNLNWERSYYESY